MSWVEGRRGRLFLALVAVEAAVVAALAVAGTTGGRDPAAPAADRQLVSELRLTDLALWPGASYCRHPSQADLFAAHAEHPATPEHFPAGSIVPPRPALGIEGRLGDGGQRPMTVPGRPRSSGPGSGAAEGEP